MVPVNRHGHNDTHYMSVREGSVAESGYEPRVVSQVSSAQRDNTKTISQSRVLLVDSDVFTFLVGSGVSRFGTRGMDVPD